MTIKNISAIATGLTIVGGAISIITGFMNKKVSDETMALKIKEEVTNQLANMNENE